MSPNFFKLLDGVKRVDQSPTRWRIGENLPDPFGGRLLNLESPQVSVTLGSIPSTHHRSKED